MNKPDFQVVVPCNLLLEKELDISLRAFHWFFHEVTNRHQRRSRLLAAAPNAAQLETLDFFWKKTGLPASSLVTVADRQEAEPTDEALLVMPSLRVGDAARVEVINWRLPAIVFDNWERARSFDAGFCLFIPQELEDQAVREFGSHIKMLYFDPGALAMLRVKARSLRRGQFA